MEQRLSLAIALVLFVTYRRVLSFSLKTHRHFFQGVKGEPEEKSEELTGVLKDLRFKLTRDAQIAPCFSSDRMARTVTVPPVTGVLIRVLKEPDTFPA